MTEEKQKGKNNKKERPPKQMKNEEKIGTDEKVVFVGQKPVKNYVIAVMMHFNTGSNQVVIKARGRAITKAVDTFELLRRAFLKNVRLDGINISTEQVTREGNQKANVSAIELTIVKS